MSKLHLTLTMLALVIGGQFIHATTCPTPKNTSFSNVAGSGITNVMVQSPNPLDGNCTEVLVTYTTSVAGDASASLCTPGTDFTGIQCNGLWGYSGTIGTAHSVVITGISPNQTCSAGLYNCYALELASCSTGPNCSRFSANWGASQPIGTSVTGGVQNFEVPTAATNSADTFAFTMRFMGSSHVYQGHEIKPVLMALQTDGPPNQPTEAYVTALSLDGQACTVTRAGGTCGTGSGDNHITVQFVCATLALYSSATRNYSTYVDSSTRYYCPYNSALTYTGSGYLPVYVDILPDTNSSNLGTHTISITVQQAGAGESPLGSPQTATWSFAVVAVPSFSITAPGSFSVPSNIGVFNAQVLPNYIKDFQGMVTQNTTLPGEYQNGSQSATQWTSNYNGMMIYGADRAALTLSRYLTTCNGTSNNPCASWAPLTSYSIGTLVSTNSAGCTTTGCNVWVVTTAGTSRSGSSPLSGTAAAGATQTDGSVTWFNLSNAPQLELFAQRAGEQMRAYYQITGKYTFWSEYSYWTDGTFMRCLLEYGAGTPCQNSNDATAIANSLYPEVPSAWGTFPQSLVYQTIVPVDTFRAQPDVLRAELQQWMITGTNPTLNGINLTKRRVDLMMEIVDQLVTNCQTPTIVNANYPCQGLSIFANPTYDGGLVLQSMIDYINVQNAESVTPDPAVMTAIGQYLNWLDANEFNQIGDYSFPYNIWTVPHNSRTFDIGITPLNDFFGAFAWWWAANGSSCTFPTTGHSCLTVAQEVFNHSTDGYYTFSGGPITGKVESEISHRKNETYSWLTGNYTALQDDIIPSLNGYVGAFPDKMEPFNQSLYNSNPTYNLLPTCTPVGSTSASCQFITSKPASSTRVYYCPGATCTPNLTDPSVSAGATTTFDSQASLYQSPVLSLVGLTSGTVYNFLVSSTDSSGNVSNSCYDASANFPSCPSYTFTTNSGPPTCSITINGTLPAGTNGTFYSHTLTKTGTSGCVAPYTFTTISCIGVGVCTAHDISGLSMSTSGTYSGTPTGAGIAALSVKVCDSELPAVCQVKLYLVTIYPAAPTNLQGFYGGTATGLTVP